MHRLKATLASAVAIAMCVLAAATTAHAAEPDIFSVSPGGRVSATSLGSLTFNSPLLRITCPGTLNGAWMPEYISAVAGAAMAGVTSGTMGRCSSGSARFDTTNAWLLTFSSLLGTLPNLTGLQLTIEDFSVLLTQTIFGITANCEYTGTVGALLVLSERGPYRTGLLSLLSRSQSFTLDRDLDTSGLCPAASGVSVEGGFTFTSTTLTQLAALGFQVIPPVRRFGSTSGIQDFVFRNISGGNVTVTRSAFGGGVPNFALDTNTCLRPEGDPRLLAQNDECLVRITFTSAGAGTPFKSDTYRLYRGAGGTTLTAFVAFDGI